MVREKYAGFTVPSPSPLLDHFGPDTTPAAYESVANDPKRTYISCVG